VDANLGASDGRPLAPAVMQQMRKHRWDRSVGTRA
jgi:hypothetical protein